MSVASHSRISAQRRRFKKDASATKKKAYETSSRTVAQNVEMLPTRLPRRSRWLKSLIFLQKGSSILTFCLIGASVVLYAQIVDHQQTWGREYKKLETLQRHERHLITINETLKNSLAQQAENPETGMIPLHPDNTIFLVPAQEPSLKSTPKETVAEEVEPLTPTPIGY